MRADVYPGAKTLIQRLKSSGRKVVLATSSVDLIVRPLADYLGIEDILATSFEFVDGVCTGRFEGRPFFGYEKMRRVIDFLQKNNVSRRDCSFYSDSVHDLPLLEVIGHPFVVNPDIRLKNIAQKRGWEILKFR